MANVKNNAATQETCRKLIDAAGEVFAECGLHAATIKQITDRAGVNIAAVNYHFRDKFELYAAVVRHVLSATPIIDSEQVAGSPEERLRAFVEHVIDDLYEPSRPAWQLTILAHEFARPTAALDAVMEELIRPRSDFLRGIVRDLLGPGASEKEVTFASASIASQFFYFLYHGPVIRRLHPQLLRGDSRRELAAHITKFSLAALSAMRSARQGGASGKSSRS